MVAVLIFTACGGPDDNEATSETTGALVFPGFPVTTHPPLEPLPLKPSFGPEACGKEVYDDIFAPIPANPTDSQRSVSLTCNLTLSEGQVVKKRLILEGAAASGVTVDCGFAVLEGGRGTPNDGKDMIEIRSTGSGDSWSRPVGVTVRNCHITGSMRIYGRGTNGEAAAVRESSRRDLNHPARLQASAPTNIRLEKMFITATERTPLYLAPGVTFVTLIDSELMGNASRTAIYLDAESAFNTFRNNSIHVTIYDEWFPGFSRLGPQVSIDTSRNNVFFNNRFSALVGGGIYTFRNCGEGGTIRHGSSSSNHIINNSFYYNTYGGGNPSVLLGARGEWYRNLGIGHCDDDEDAAIKVGSALSNDDYSRHNVVMQNQIYKLSTSLMIREGDSSNRPNIIDRNETVTTAVSRRAGCYIVNAYKNFLLDGERLDVFLDVNGGPVCTGAAATCADGHLSYSPSPTCGIVQAPFSCQVTGSNAGCTKVVGCPAGRVIVGAKAACNLEYGAVTATEVNGAWFNMLKVVRDNDSYRGGTCTLAGTTAYTGQQPLADFLDRRLVNASCKEHDENGGDCDIRGTFYCR